MANTYKLLARLFCLWLLLAFNITVGVQAEEVVATDACLAWMQPNVLQDEAVATDASCVGEALGDLVFVDQGAEETVIDADVDPSVALQGLAEDSVAAASATAATFLVNTSFDTSDATQGNGRCADATGLCSLRAAIEESNAQRGTSQITLPAGTYILTQGQLLITNGLALNGAGRGQTFISGNQQSRVFEIAQSNVPTKTIVVYMTGVTIQRGAPKIGDVPAYLLALSDVPPGGGILIGKGSFLTLKQSLVWRNETRGPGSGIANYKGFLYLIESIMENNHNVADAVNRWHAGGALANWGTTYIERSVIRINTAPRAGGIVNQSGRLGIKNSTVFFNSAQLYGGGLAVHGGVVSIAFSTITANQANANPNANSSEPRVGGGIYQTGGSILIGNTILADNTDGRGSAERDYSPDCYTTPGALSSYRGNLLGILTANCGLRDFEFGDTRYDFVGAPQAPLRAGDNLLIVDRANPRFACPPTDQNNSPRPQDGNNDGMAICDIGAIELPAQTGADTSCTFATFWAGGSRALAGEQLDGFSIGALPALAPAAAETSNEVQRADATGDDELQEDVDDTDTPETEGAEAEADAGAVQQRVFLPLVSR